jgi:hypothetical protein
MMHQHYSAHPCSARLLAAIYHALSFMIHSVLVAIVALSVAFLLIHHVPSSMTHQY